MRLYAIIVYLQNYDKVTRQEFVRRIRIIDNLVRNSNDEVVDRFLERNPQFKEIPFLENIGGPFGKGRATVFPKDFGSDGFFICKMKRGG